MSRTTIEDRNTRIDVSSLRVLDDMILIRVIEREKTGGGIWLPRNKATELCVGEVVAAGPGGTSAKCLRRYPIELRPGDIVFTMGYIGDRMELRDAEYRFVHDHGIWARVTWKCAESLDFATVEPRFGNVVVEPEDETKMRNGILFYPNAENKMAEMRLAKVALVGPGPWNADTGTRRAPELRPGDGVLIVRYAGAEITIEGRKFRILNETDIRAFAEEEE